MILTSKEARELLEIERKNAKDDRWIEHSICVGDSAGILAKALNEKGLTKEEIAKAIGCGIATVYRVVKTNNSIE